MNLPASASFFRRNRTLLLAALLTFATGGLQAAHLLGSAQSLAVFGNTSVSNTGATVLTGDLGVNLAAPVGFPPGIVTGATHSMDATTALVRTDALAAFDALNDLPFDQDLSGTDLGGLTLDPGVYFYSAAAVMNGVLTLDGQNQVDPLFVFQIGSTLGTASPSSFNLINGATADNIWFTVGSSSTLGTGTTFSGNILALASHTVGAGVTVDGRVIAINGAVTLASNLITVPVAAIPEPAGAAALFATLALAAATGRRARRSTLAV